MFNWLWKFHVNWNTQNNIQLTWICNKMGRITWLAVCEPLLPHSTRPAVCKCSCNERKLISNVMMIGPSSVEVKNEWSYTSIPPCVFMACTGTTLTFINLGFVSLCIIIYSNKSTNQMHQSLRFIAYRLNTAQHVSGIPHAHHQELINCSSRLWFTLGTWW